MRVPRVAALSLSDRDALPRSTFPFPVPAMEEPVAKKLSAHRELLSGAIGHSGSQTFLLRRDCTQEARCVKPQHF